MYIYRWPASCRTKCQRKYTYFEVGSFNIVYIVYSNRNIYIYIYIYLHLHLQRHLYIYMYIYIYTYTYTNTYTYIDIAVLTCIYIYINEYIYIYRYSCLLAALHVAQQALSWPSKILCGNFNRFSTVQSVVHYSLSLMTFFFRIASLLWRIY